MNSINFELLRPAHPALADLGGFAEHYAYSDPSSSLIKQRGFVEQVVAVLFHLYELQRPYNDTLFERLEAPDFKASVPNLVLSRLHTVRIAGNHAAHPRRPLTPERALEALRATFEIGLWFHLQTTTRPPDPLPSFQPPPRPDRPRAAQRAALEQLRLAEVQHATLLAEVERVLRREADARAASPPADVLAKHKDEGDADAKRLHFDEATTRARLIDQLLIAAGWDVGPNLQDTEQVKREVELWQLPTESGHGFADYVLYGDDGKALAVVEAKRTAQNAQVGAEQARTYAMGLERIHGVRPLIYSTNGLDLYLWDDARYPSYRRVHGFYSNDSLETLLFQRNNARPLATVAASPEIAGRMYQLEAIRRVCDRFDDKFRRALIVQATGTGKTRVAVSLVELLMRAGWVKRVLFLCDRRELRRQADDVFKEFLPGEPRLIVDAATASNRDARIYLATYPAMMQAFESFDVGFFDLIIADESHRSIYRKYRAPFLYFDALQIGLTATPITELDRNTFGLFGCEDGDPTYHFSLQDALESTPPYLVPPRVLVYESKFRKEGMNYRDMNEEQRAQANDEDPNAEAIAFEPKAIDDAVFNKHMTRRIWSELMTHGIRETTATRVGKTIVFARNHKHAVHLHEEFLEAHPDLGANFCRVIDNYEPRAEELLRQFKDPTHELSIAISVDMLDTGIDVPEVVNLVFAKPLASYVKFWQMLGRGTRLRPHLFGAGRHKTEFLVFDHWGNFAWFDEEYEQPEPKPRPKSLLERLFDARLDLAQAALDRVDLPTFEATVTLLTEDVRAVADSPDIEAREHRSAILPLAERDRIAAFDPATVDALRSVAAPLMRVRRIRGEEDAYRFDLLMTRLQTALLRGGPDAQPVQDLRGRVEAAVASLAKNQNPVKAKADSLQRVQRPAFWAAVTPVEADALRLDLRGIMRFQQGAGASPLAPRVLDIMDVDETVDDYVPRLEGLDLIIYRKRVEGVIEGHFADNPTLICIRNGQPVDDAELRALAQLILEIDDRANVLHLVGHDPTTRISLLSVFRSLVGLDADAVARAFDAFTAAHGLLSAQQNRFLQLVKNHIAKNGGIEIDRLYEAPFTTLHADGVDGVFRAPEQVEDLLRILIQFEPQPAPHPDKRAS